jgi:hypothetical protein
MSVAIEDVLEFFTGARIPAHRATTNHLSALNPFFAESGFIDKRTGVKVPGLAHGFCGVDDSGGIFFFDEYLLYKAGLLNFANVGVLGQPNFRKSTGVKNMIYHGAAAGYNHLVTDRKDHEYKRLADNMNRSLPGSAKTLHFGEGSDGDGYFINPVDPAMDIDTRRELIAALALNTMSGNRTELDEEESTILWAALIETEEYKGHGTHDVATLPVLVEKLFHPTDSIVKYAEKEDDPLYVKQHARKMALGLKRLTEGDLKGMFHKKTTINTYQDQSLLIMDLDGIKGEKVVVMITLINFFTQSMMARSNPAFRFHKVIHDETWDLAAYAGFVESLRRANKLGGTWGVANWWIAHHEQNMVRSGNLDAVNDIIDDTEVFFCYQMKEKPLRASQDALGLSDAEVKRNLVVPPGTALVKVGKTPAIEMRQYITDDVRPLVETRDRMRGKTDLVRAEDEPVENEQAVAA